MWSFDFVLAFARIGFVVWYFIAIPFEIGIYHNIGLLDRILV